MSEKLKMDPNTLVDPKFIGIPYALGKSSLEGADCIGLLIMWVRETFGIEYEYDDKQGAVMENWWERNPRRFLDAFLQLGDIVHFHDLKKYDVLMLFGTEQSSYPSCLGIMVDDRHFLMMLEGRGSFVEKLNLYWKSKFFGAIRLHKIKEATGA